MYRSFVASIIALCLNASTSAEDRHRGEVVPNSEPEIEKIGTWNVHWLGQVNTDYLENIDRAKDYAKYIHNTGARLVALQEVVP